LSDFNTVYKEGDFIKNFSGTKNYRAPESRLREHIDNLCSLDIFSIGISLFVMISGFEPYQEGEMSERLFFENRSKYWEKMDKMIYKKLKLHFSEDFRRFFDGLTNKDSSKRMNLDEVLGSEWYNLEVYKDEELVVVMRELFMAEGINGEGFYGK
jgi:serine/threonine protein kinase